MYWAQAYVHLMRKSGDKWIVVCIGGDTEYRLNGVVMNHPGYQRTEDIRAVTCPACKKAVSK